MLSKQKLIVECLNHLKHTVILFFTLFVTCNLIGCPEISGPIMLTLTKSAKEEI